jgi:hypothetical protein
VPKPRPACGTAGGYKAHRRRDEEACPACREAWRVDCAAARDSYTPEQKEARKQSARDRRLGATTHRHEVTARQEARLLEKRLAKELVA